MSHDQPSARRARRLTDDDAELFIAQDLTFMRGQRYPISVWQLVNGDRVAIVASVSGNQPLEHVAKRLATAVTARWAPCRILGRWPSPTPGRSDRFAWLLTTGSRRADLDELARLGLDLR